jgi:hypothetical protein
MHPTYVSCKISVVEFTYRSVTWLIFLMDIIRSNYVNFYEIICSYEAKNVEKHNFLK